MGFHTRLSPLNHLDRGCVSLLSCGGRCVGGQCREIGIALDPLSRTSSVLVLAAVVPTTRSSRATRGNGRTTCVYWRSLSCVHGALFLCLLVVDTDLQDFVRSSALLLLFFR